jgi:hypothetical protein
MNKPDELLRDVTRWFIVIGVIACFTALVPLIATLIAAAVWTSLTALRPHITK